VNDLIGVISSGDIAPRAHCLPLGSELLRALPALNLHLPASIAGHYVDVLAHLHSFLSD
jgi:hypothetical protein